jgi:glycosyltransferase involved in cell wall biosynthesis
MFPRVQFLSFDDPNHVSGVSTWLQKTVPPLRRLGIDARVDLLCHQDPGLNLEWFTRNDVPVRWARYRGDTNTVVRQCLRWVRQDMPSVYVPNCVLPAYFAAAEARRCGMRTIGMLHSDDPFYWGIVDEFIKGREQWRLTDLVAVSRFLKKAVEAVAAPGITLHEIPYGVAVPSSTAVRKDGVLRLVYTGRLIEEQKRISEVTRAFCRAVRRHSNLEAWIVGWGPHESNARKIIEDERLQEKVILKGRVHATDIHAILEQCHIHVLLSDYEGLPVALLEAMAAGVVPVCLNMRSGVSDVLRHQENGMIVHDREQSFLDAIDYLAGNIDAWTKMSLAARQTVIDRFSEERCVALWKDLLTSHWTSKSTTQRPRLKLELPPRNPIFEHRDRRFTRVQRPWFFIRRKVSHVVRQTRKFLNSPP